MAIIATGETVYPALQAAKKLKEQNVAATVVSMHTIKPLDTSLLADLANKCKAIVTVEEHSVIWRIRRRHVLLTCLQQ